MSAAVRSQESVLQQKPSGLLASDQEKPSRELHPFQSTFDSLLDGQLTHSRRSLSELKSRIIILLRDLERKSTFLNINLCIQRSLSMWFKQIFDNLNPPESPTTYGFPDLVESNIDEQDSPISPQKVSPTLSLYHMQCLDALNLSDAYDNVERNLNFYPSEHVVFCNLLETILSFYKPSLPSGFRLIKDFSSLNSLLAGKETVKANPIKQLMAKTLYWKFYRRFLSICTLTDGLVKRKEGISDHLGKGACNVLQLIPVAGPAVSSLAKSAVGYGIDQIRMKEFNHILDYVMLSDPATLAKELSDRLIKHYEKDIAGLNENQVLKQSHAIFKRVYTIMTTEPSDECLTTDEALGNILDALDAYDQKTKKQKRSMSSLSG